MKAFLAIAASVLFFATPCRAADWKAFGQGICDEQGEGIHVVRYDNGEVKASVVCEDGPENLYVKQGRYFDRQGRGLAQEENEIGAPAKSRFREWVYDAAMGPPVEERLYDGAGKLLSKKAVKGAAARKKEERPAPGTWIPGTYNDYVDLCQSQPAEVLRPVMGPANEPQYFPDQACACIAEKAVRGDDERDLAGLKKKGLDYKRPIDRLSFAAGRHLSDCVCPNVVPGTHLDALCRHPEAIEAQWRAPRD